MSKSEAVVQQEIRADAPNQGVILWRNNSGACTDETGRLIRYGLGNDSAQLNKRIKSSDLIGITPLKITQDMVGLTVGLFTAVEVKHSDWGRFKLNEREIAQAEFHRVVSQYGGVAGFANGVDGFRKLIGR